MAVAVEATVQPGLNGFYVYRGRLGTGMEVTVPLASGTPSLVAALERPPSSPLPLRLVLAAPDGRPVEASVEGVQVVTGAEGPVAFVVTDPEEGDWTLRVASAEPSDGALEVAIVAAAQDEPRESLLAAAATMPDPAQHNLPHGVLPLLTPVCVALRPLCGRPAAASPPPSVVAAADLTGAGPDEIQDALEALPPAAPTWRIAQALAVAAGI